jgi:hypothetical protein
VPPGSQPFTAYQETRDRLMVPLLKAAAVIAAYRWTDDEIPALLMELFSSMTTEIEAISAFDAVSLPAA